MSRSLTKLKYIDKYLWRKLFLSFKLQNFNTYDKFMYSRSSTFLNNPYINYIYVYKGNNWIKRYTNIWRIGYKLGSFTWNKTPAQFKKKKKKKN